MPPIQFCSVRIRPPSCGVVDRSIIVRWTTSRSSTENVPGRAASSIADSIAVMLPSTSTATWSLVWSPRVNAASARTSRRGPATRPSITEDPTDSAQQDAGQALEGEIGGHDEVPAGEQVRDVGVVAAAPAVATARAGCGRRRVRGRAHHENGPAGSMVEASLSSRAM